MGYDAGYRGKDYWEQQRQWGKNKKHEKKEEIKRKKQAEEDLKKSIKSTEHWAKRYMEQEGLTYEQAMIKAWNRSKVNRGSRYKGF